MKILQVIPFFNPKFGGPVKGVYYLSEELSKRGHEITLITTDLNYNENYVIELEKQGVEVICFKCVFNFASFLYSPSMEKWIKSNIQKFDLIDLHEFRSYQNNIVHIYSKLYDKPYILQAHGSVLPFFQKQKLKKVYDFFWGYKLLKDAAIVIALTETELNQYKKMGVPENKIEIIPNGINLIKDQNLPKRGLFRKKYDIKNDENVILYLGRIHKIKGIDLLLKSFYLLSKEMGNIKLIIVGPGKTSNLKKMIKGSLIENKVIFTGPLYGENKYEAFIDSDLYVLPSIYEAFGHTVLEAFSFSKPVVVTEGCGIKDIIHKRAGYAVKYDKNSLKDAMFSILNDEDLKRSFGENGKVIVSKVFNLDIVMNKIELLYKNIVREFNEKS
jgi:glycosyltransferase involved in cell wall biosynthesis